MSHRTRLVVAFALVIPIATRALGQGFGRPCCNLERLIGASNGYLVNVDPENGQVELASGRGLIGYEIGGLAYDPATEFIYAVDVNGNQLIRMSRSSWEMSVVGAVGVPGIAGLAFDSNSETLYGASTSTRDLVTINPLNGGTSVVGDVGLIDGLAFDGTRGVLYGSNGHRVYSIDPQTADRELVIDLPYGGLDGLTYDESADAILATSTYGPRLLTIDAETLEYSFIASFDFDMVGLAIDPETGQVLSTTGSAITMKKVQDPYELFAFVDGYDIRGLTAHWYEVDLLYAVTADGNILRLDRHSGEYTVVGDTGYDAIESLVLSPFDELLYAVDTQSDVLLRIDPQDAQTEIVGQVGFDHVAGLAVHNALPWQFLFGIDRATSQLLQIDFSTAASTVVGTVNFGPVESLAYNLAAGDALYGIVTSGDQQGQLITIDTKTAAAEPVMTFPWESVHAFAILRNPTSLVGIDAASHAWFTLELEDRIADETVADLAIFPAGDLAYVPESSRVYASRGNEYVYIDATSGLPVSTSARATGTIAGMTYDRDSRLIYAVDTKFNRLNAFDPVSEETVYTVPLGAIAPTGLAYDNATQSLYGIVPNDGHSIIVQIDPNTGDTGTITTIDDYEFDAITFDEFSQRLLAGHGEIVSINPVTGDTEWLGTLGVEIAGLAADSVTGTIFAFSEYVDALLTLSPTTREMTTIGAVGLETIYDITFDPHRSLLYGYARHVKSFIQLDLEAGRATVTGTLLPVDFDDLAFDPLRRMFYAIRQDTELIRIEPDGGRLESIGQTGQQEVLEIAFDAHRDALIGSRRALELLQAHAPEIVQIDTESAHTVVLSQSNVTNITFDPVTSLVYATLDLELLRGNPQTWDIDEIATLSAYVSGLTVVSTDCNNNGIPDACDVEDGTSWDENANSVPDECECILDTDCDDLMTCTQDFCHADVEQCAHLPRHDLCDDGGFCNRIELCDPQAGCVPGPTPCSADDVCAEYERFCVEDCDVDGDIDLENFAVMQACFTGPGGSAGGQCACADLNNDGHVDLIDWSILQSVFQNAH